jgi:hypothetical protein
MTKTTKPMATERQIAANRANAAKSTGPRSATGKKRSASNSLSHGLTTRYSSAEFTRQLEELARQIAGNINDQDELELARTVAEAELDLARVRRVKAALVDRVAVTGGLVPARHFRTKREQTKWFNATLRWIASRQDKPADPIMFNPADSMPSSKPARTMEAARRLLPTLDKLMRYERRAAARRDRAIKAMMLRQSRPSL